MDTIATSVHGQPPRVTLKALLEAGVHFGHQAKRWNPKMKPFIFAERNGIHIIDLQQTVPLLAAAHDFVVDATSRGGKILFVGTKKQAQDVVEREAKRSGQYYVNRRWLGGTLTNWTVLALYALGRCAETGPDGLGSGASPLRGRLAGR